MHMMNRYGEMGSHFLIPLDGLKVSVLPPFTRIEMEEELMQDKINLVSPGGKLKV